MRLTTIRSSREIDRIFREGARASTGNLVVLASPTPYERGPQGRVAFVAGTKLGGAVVRNRAKRRLREAARSAGAPWAAWDVVILARPGVLKAPAQQVGEDLVRRLANLGVTA
jgi:ribonuclease P protein component